jgi:hypothetical protein
MPSRHTRSCSDFVNLKPGYMNKKIVLMGCACLFFFLHPSFAQLRPIPTAVTNAFSKQYSGATDVKYSDQLSGVFISFKLNGDKMTASYTNKGVWQKTEQESTFDRLPEEVKNGFQKSRYADRAIDETKLIHQPQTGDSVQYRLRAVKSGVEKKYLLFNSQGRLMKETVTF